MRTSELLGLQWDNVNFERSQILVRTTWVCGELDTPKTDGSERTIEMSSPVAAALRQQRELTEGKGSAFVFCAENGQPLSRHNLANRVWRLTLKALGLRHRRPYQPGTRPRRCGSPLARRLSGFASRSATRQTKMLFTVYSRYVPNLTRKDGYMFKLLIGGGLGAAPGRSRRGIRCPQLMPTSRRRCPASFG